MTDPSDEELAARYGLYASFDSPASPALVKYYGENPADEMARLLRLHGGPESNVLDIGCGAGQTLCWLAPLIGEVWGFEQDTALLASARRRVAAHGLDNVTLIEGTVAVPADVARLPEGHFDLAFSQRGPNLNAALLRALRPDAIFIQEFVGPLNGNHLGEIFGRRPITAGAAGDYRGLLGQYAELDLFPVSVKEYFFESFFRDAEHLALFLGRGLTLSNWRLPRRPYDPDRDRAALDLYARYNTTPAGIRVLAQRYIFALRRARVHYYPADSTL
ncbi:MAG TPA: class I SAM-dependent methyltransferase [Thermomicrobiales bacterium]|nr:class I SAM-dependent methyltransferase [Thermomicrobiales bacterium]